MVSLVFQFALFFLVLFVGVPAAVIAFKIYQHYLHQNREGRLAEGQFG